MADQQAVLYEGAAIADTGLGVVRPGAVAVRSGRIVASGPPHQVRQAVDRWENVVRVDDALIFPGMVNAHVHLDLTGIGPQPRTGDFADWVMMVQKQRGARGAVAAGEAVEQGAAMCVASGVAAVGDIASWLSPGAARAILEASALVGVSFAELIGIDGPRRQEQVARIETLAADACERMGIKVGLQPHAPYSTGPGVYEAATQAACGQGLAVSTHLAELREEIEFVAKCTGRLRQLHESLGVWDDDSAAHYGSGHHPVKWLEPYLQRARWLVAHCNYVDDEHIEALARCRASVAYCPVASDYFGHRDHHYRDMLAGQVNVCLGTDSIVCQPADEPQPLGILAQMRYLYRRDRTEPEQLLAMATVNGCKALGLAAHHATLQAGAAARLYTVRFDSADPRDPLTQVLENRYPVEPLTIVENMS